MFRSPPAFGDAHDDVAGFFEGGSTGIDDETRAFDQSWVQLTRGRAAGTDRDDVGAVGDPFAFDDWRCRRSDSNDNISATNYGFSAGHRVCGNLVGKLV